MTPVIIENVLLDLLQSNGWFTEGTPKQLNKLREANESGVDLKALAGFIFACSDNTSYYDIYQVLYDAEQAEFEKLFKDVLLTTAPYVSYEVG